MLKGKLFSKAAATKKTNKKTCYVIFFRLTFLSLYVMLRFDPCRIVFFFPWFCVSTFFSVVAYYFYSRFVHSLVFSLQEMLRPHELKKKKRLFIAKLLPSWKTNPALWNMPSDSLRTFCGVQLRATGVSSRFTIHYNGNFYHPPYIFNVFYLPNLI